VVQVSYSKVCEELDPVGDMAAVPGVPRVLAAQQEVVAAV